MVVPQPDPSTPSPRERGVSEFFDQRALSWEDGYRTRKGYPRHFFAERMKRVLDLAGPLERLSVLDIGCASGDYLHVLGERGAVVAGTDLSPAMVRRANQRARSEQWPRLRGVAVSSGTALPFPAGTFDMALCIGVIEYVPNSTDLLAEAHRVLRPGGRLILTAPNPTSPAVRLEIAIHGMMSRVRGVETDPYHRRLEPRDICDLLETAGFDDMKTASASYLPYNVALRLPGSVALDRGLSTLARVLGTARTGATFVVSASRKR